MVHLAQAKVEGPQSLNALNIGTTGNHGNSEHTGQHLYAFSFNTILNRAGRTASLVPSVLLTLYRDVSVQCVSIISRYLVHMGSP